MQAQDSGQTVRFAAFELDLKAGELRRSGVRLPVQGRPLQLLAILLRTPGELVTAEQLRTELWPADTFVDFEHGVRNAVARLRAVLGDVASTEGEPPAPALAGAGRILAHARQLYDDPASRGAFARGIGAVAAGSSTATAKRLPTRGPGSWAAPLAEYRLGGWAGDAVANAAISRLKSAPICYVCGLASALAFERNTRRFLT